MAIISPAITNFKAFYEAYKVGLADTGSADLEPLYTPNPAHVPTNEDFDSRLADVQNTFNDNRDIRPMTASDFQAFWAVPNSQSTFITRLGRCGLIREPQNLLDFNVVQRQTFASLSPELNEIVSTLLAEMEKDTTNLEGLVGSNLVLITEESDHFPDDLSPATGVEGDRTSALRLRAMKVYIRDSLNMRLI